MRKITLSQGKLTVTVLTYGATLQSIRYYSTDVALGYDTVEEYQQYGAYLGATVGRYANRIADGRFSLNGVEYDVGCNEKGRGHLHGGRIGLDKKVWTVREESETAVTLETTLADGEEGYPGNMKVAVTFEVNDDTLRIIYEAVSDADTVFNPTNHCYFNLNGFGSVEDHRLAIFADSYLPVNEKMIPTGEIRSVKGTPFDFTNYKRIGEEIDADDEQIRLGGGYDHTFVLREGSGMKAKVEGDASGYIMACYTDMPGLQLYTGNFLDQPTGKKGPIGKREGFCLETQFFPDSPNRPEFPSCVLKAGEPFRSVTAFEFWEKR